MKFHVSLAVLFSLTSITSAGGGGQLAPTAAAKGFLHEPALVYDVTGSTIAGPVHTSFTVYNDGSLSLAQFFNFVGGDGSVTTTQIAPRFVRRLVRDLDDAGASQLPDSVSFVTDTPYQTVTFMKPGTDTEAHTFTILDGTPAHGPVFAIINQFIADHVTQPPAVSAGSSSESAAVSSGKFLQEPVLLFDVTGSSIAGPVHESVVVYNNGLVSISELRQFLGNDGSTRTVNIDPADVTALSVALGLAGAASLQDAAPTLPDLPVSTVTYLRGGTDAKAHTFSVTFGSPAHSAVLAIIQAFLASLPPAAS